MRCPLGAQSDEHRFRGLSMDSVEQIFDQLWRGKAALTLRESNCDLVQRVAVVSEWVERLGGFGISEVVGPAPWRGADVGVDEVRVGPMGDKHAGAV